MPLFYLSLAIDKTIKSKIPEMPKKWIFQEGWTKYENGKSFPVEHPEEDVLFFDIDLAQHTDISRVNTFHMHFLLH